MDDFFDENHQIMHVFFFKIAYYLQLITSYILYQEFDVAQSGINLHMKLSSILFNGSFWQSLLQGFTTKVSDKVLPKYSSCFFGSS